MIYDGLMIPLKSFGIGAKETQKKKKRKGKGDNNEHH